MLVTTIITFVVIFGLLILFHEWGHFVTARKFGVRVEEFGFGLPPRLIGWHRTGGRWRLLKKDEHVDTTIYSLNWIPFGGFVRLFGEEGEHAAEPDSFSAQGKLPRAIILSAGVAMNVLFTVLLLSIGFMAGTPSVIEEEISPRAALSDISVQVVNVMNNSPAAHAGIKVGDAIRAVNGVEVQSIRAFQDQVQEQGGREFTLILVSSDRAQKEAIVRAETLPEGEGKAVIGVGLIRTAVVSYPWYLAIPEGLRATGELARNLLHAFGEIFKSLLTTGKTDAVVSGPVGIAVLTGQVVHLGFLYIMQFAATLSLNLAIINYIPFPALDGGRVLFIVIEALRGKAVSKKFEAALHTIGFALLITLIVFITYRDIARHGGGIWNALRQIFT